MASQPIDIKLYNVVPDNNNHLGYYDVQVADNGDLELCSGFDTSMTMSIFCDRRAEPYEALYPEFRRGWWGNMNNDDPTFEIGSKLWLLDTSRLTTTTLNLAETYVRDGLQWLITDRHLNDVEVTSSAVYTGDLPSITLEVKLRRKDTPTEYKYYSVWQSTGL